MALETGRIRLVPTPETTACEMCGARYLPGLEFVVFDNQVGHAGDIPPGLIETVDDRVGTAAYRARSAYGGEVETIVVRKPQMCSACIKQAAEQVGYGDRAPLLEELAERDEQNANLRERLDQESEARSEAERLYHDAVLRERILERRLTAAEQTAGAAKRQPAKKA